MSSTNRALAELLRMEIDSMYMDWGRSKPLRTGAPHASAILQPESEWCTRRQVLLALYPEEAKRPPEKPWDVLANARFLHGWTLHEKYQDLIRKFGRVVYFNNNLDTPELDYTHFDVERFLYYSPDAITEFGGQQLIWEFKGYKQETFVKLDELGNPPTDAHKQCNFYCHLMGIEQGVVFVENKNTQEYKIWTIEKNLDMARPYIDRAYQVKGKVSLARAGKLNVLPARACKSCNEHRAEKCPVRDVCWKLGE